MSTFPFKALGSLFLQFFFGILHIKSINDQVLLDNWASKRSNFGCFILLMKKGEIR